jgi:hypothetical protein
MKAEYKELYSEYRNLEHGAAHVSAFNMYRDFRHQVCVIRLWTTRPHSETAENVRVKYGEGVYTSNDEAKFIREAIAMFEEYVTPLAPHENDDESNIINDVFQDDAMYGDMGE